MTWEELIKKAEGLGFSYAKETFYSHGDSLKKDCYGFEGSFVFYQNGNVEYYDKNNNHSVIMMFNQSPSAQYEIMKSLRKIEKSLKGLRSNIT